MTQHFDKPPEYLKPRECARLPRVGYSRVVDWIRSGELRAIVVGGGDHLPHYRIARADLNEFVDSRHACKV